MDNKYIVRGTDGSIDINGSVNAFATQLATVAQAEISTASIAEAVDAVYDAQDAGKRLPMAALVSLATTELSPEATQIGAVQKRVHSWVRAQARFSIQKGVGGGVSRLALEGEPIPAKVAKTAS